MRTFETTRLVKHSADKMFSLVADIEKYPEFVPLCSEMRVLEIVEESPDRIQIARMTAAYKAFSDSFTCKVTEKPDEQEIAVQYLDGPFRSLNNIWRFTPLDESSSEIYFYIAYEFRSRALQFVAGAVFEKAFSKFTGAFETRADKIYGT